MQMRHDSVPMIFSPFRFRCRCFDFPPPPYAFAFDSFSLTLSAALLMPHAVFITSQLPSPAADAPVMPFPLYFAFAALFRRLRHDEAMTLLYA